jgi:type I restriction enzyme, R subunit
VSVNVDEYEFESEIAGWLVQHGGYRAGEPENFDPALGIDTYVLATFIGKTQGDEWEKLVMLHGGVTETAQRAFYARLAAELDKRGTVDVLRHGVIDQGVHVQLAYFRPAHGLTPELVQRYDANRLTVTRQLRYEVGTQKAVDLALFVNGIPVATAEIKNPITGQTIDHAKAQYRADRDPRNLTLARRAVVHFAIDTEQVAMTTRLAGAKTVFLPFNRGNNSGPGNPPVAYGHRSSYLWREVWSRHKWLDLLQRFVHMEKPASSKDRPTVIFPRYHQWEAVRHLEAAAHADGAGHDYLVQHSAGSGKSNTIAWLAHRLASLHDDAENAVFDKVVVITDRTVLDKQLQDTIYQFEHVHGVVQKIDKDSKQLAAALAGAQARIIITTLQKFPVVMRQGARLSQRKYAVIVDEAHSSQSGESVADLKNVIGSAGDDVDPDLDPQQYALTVRAKARGKQPNLSFFAFTATPKASTLQDFGRRNPDTDDFEPFHLYSMRQAIEEGFILDVLANYITYKTYWNIQKITSEDPQYDTAKAKAAIARFVSLHEHNLAQKAEIIIEHFRQHVSAKLDGKAKAMVVTGSRKHAVKYQQALKAYCREHGYPIGTLVAFSGTVKESDGPDAPKWTEAGMNGFPDSQTARQFATDDYQILVVAEKYQTGFDQPLLYAMYVDKALEGLAAVQTLSRLNRPYDRKDGTFVLDFRNEPGEIQKSFGPWYSETVSPPTDPNQMYDTRRELNPYGVLLTDEVERAVGLILGVPSDGSHGRVHAALAPAIDRFGALDQGDQDAFRYDLLRFLRAYAFLSQVVAFTDTGLERDYIFCKALAAFIRPASEASLDLGSEVELTRLRTERKFAGSLALDPETHGEVSVVIMGGGRPYQPETEPLSKIISSLNERFGTDWKDADFVGFFGGAADKIIADRDIQQAAAVNTPENFKLVLTRAFDEQVAQQMSAAQDMALRFLQDPGLRDAVVSMFLPFIQGRAIAARQEYCPIGDLLGPDRESNHLEYKASLRTLTSGELSKRRETETLKTVAAFANSRDGGTLLIGVTDAGVPCGLAGDYAWLRTRGKHDRDAFQLRLIAIVKDSMGAAVAANLSVQFHTIDGLDVCRVHVNPSAYPVDAVVTAEKNGQTEKKTVFYVRAGNSTHALTPTEKARYLLNRWPPPAQ